MTRYTLRRTGQFSVVTTGEHHCGTTNPLDIRYRLVVNCSSDSTDRRGFLFDQTRVQAWFETIKSTSMSCELFAQQCARTLYKNIKAENGKTDILSISLALSPAPYAAEIEYSWEGETRAVMHQAPLFAPKL